MTLGIQPLSSLNHNPHQAKEELKKKNVNAKTFSLVTTKILIWLLRLSWLDDNVVSLDRQKLCEHLKHTCSAADAFFYSYKLCKRKQQISDNSYSLP